MGNRYHRARKDANHAEIEDLLRSLGFKTKDVSPMKEFVDIVAKLHGVIVLIEVKDGSKPPSKRKLTDDERAFHEYWGDDIRVIETREDVFALRDEIINKLRVPAILVHD